MRKGAIDSTFCESLISCSIRVPIVTCMLKECFPVLAIVVASFAVVVLIVDVFVILHLGFILESEKASLVSALDFLGRAPCRSHGG